MLADGYTDVPPGRVAAVVTYLEMREPPHLPPIENPAGFVIRRMDKPNLEVYRGLFRAIGEQWLWFSRLRMSDGELRAVLCDEAVEVYLLEHEGVAKGIAELDRRGFPDIELTFFGVTEDLIGKGAGRYLLRFAIERAWEHSPRRFHLHTCTNDHPRALGFYVKAGFRPYKRAVEVAPDPRLTGDLPEGAAPHIPLL